MMAMKSVLGALGIKTAQDTRLLQLFLSSEAQEVREGCGSKGLVLRVEWSRV